MELFHKRDEGPGFTVDSFSGNERNRMFLQTDGNFDEVSLVSGADFREDGRGFVLFDFDHDGYLDMGVVSPNRPRFRILKNTMGDDQATPNHSAFVNLVGGHNGTESQSQWSARDAYGATLLVTIGNQQRAYQASCGEGLASQNSKWIHLSLGQSETIDRIEVTWPSGKKTIQEKVSAGERVTLFENENQGE